MNNNGVLLVVSAPSGCGKDTIIADVLKKLDDAYLSVSMTTRPMRPGEKDGINYYFVSQPEFEEKIDCGEMLEYARYGSNYYGTPAGPVRKLLEEGKTVILIIEVQGAGNVKRMFPEACNIFIIPPSFEILEKRLRGRGTDDDESIIKRLDIAKDELARAEEFDYIVENDVLEEAVEDILTIIKAEKLKVNKMKNKLSEVINNA
jgi:guanylate kinase